MAALTASVRGRCRRCGHPRVAPGSGYCWLCRFRVCSEILAGLPDPLEPTDSEREHVRLVGCQPARGIPKIKLTLEDLDRPELWCPICGGEHARIDCGKERLRWGYVRVFRCTPMHQSNDNVRGSLGGLAEGQGSLSPRESARRYWQWLTDNGWIENGHTRSA